MQDPDYPDCDLNFSVTNVAIKRIREILEGIPDGYVMLETVAYEEDYTGDRSDISLTEPYATLMHNAKFLPGEKSKR
jgi:hypothetical protein